MITPRAILDAEVCYDIIVGDFGRDATINYLHDVSLAERSLIERALKPHNLEFFDEYRRIMYTVISDVAFLKRKAIASSIAVAGSLSNSILIGVGSPITQDFADSFAFAVGQEIQTARQRGHSRIRVIIPCNTLSGLVVQLEDTFKSRAEMQRIAEAFNASHLSNSFMLDANVSFHSVPEAVVQFAAASSKGDRPVPLLILGTEMTNELYIQLAESTGISVLELTVEGYELINRAVVASVGGDESEISHVRQEIYNTLISPLQEESPDLIVIEACTDFNLDLGLNSLQVFAEAMVNSLYDQSLGLAEHSLDLDFQ